MEKNVWDCVIKAELGIITCSADEQRRRPQTFITFILSDDFGNLIFFPPTQYIFKKQTIKNQTSSNPLKPTTASNTRNH